MCREVRPACAARAAAWGWLFRAGDPALPLLAALRAVSLRRSAAPRPARTAGRDATLSGEGSKPDRRFNGQAARLAAFFGFETRPYGRGDRPQCSTGARRMRYRCGPQIGGPTPSQRGKADMSCDRQ